MLGVPIAIAVADPAVAVKKAKSEAPTVAGRAVANAVDDVARGPDHIADRADGGRSDARNRRAGGCRRAAAIAATVAVAIAVAIAIAGIRVVGAHRIRGAWAG